MSETLSPLSASISALVAQVLSLVFLLPSKMRGSVGAAGPAGRDGLDAEPEVVSHLRRPGSRGSVDAAGAGRDGGDGRDGSDSRRGSRGSMGPYVGSEVSRIETALMDRGRDGSEGYAGRDGSDGNGVARNR